MTKQEEFRTLCVLAAWGYACGDGEKVCALAKKGLVERLRPEGSREYGVLTETGKHRLIELVDAETATKETW